MIANVTAVDVSEPTFLTVCPGGAALPDTSNLNPVPGRATPNLVVMGLGAGGTIDVHNSVGETNCIVDVFGYFDAVGGDRLHPLEPSRLLDTRSGVGIDAAGRVGRGQRVDLQVTGQGGVPSSGVSAVVLNVTVDQPASDGFLSVGPGGEAIPETSNLNFVAGLTVPNLVVCKVGDGGMVSFSAECDAVHLIADVFGYFGSDGAKVRTVRPERLLDTRSGTGAPQQPVGSGNPVTLQVTGRGGVPSTATAVVLNVTATQVTATSFVTVWPTGTPMSDTSNLNMTAGGTSANLVITKLGAGGTVDIANAFGEAHLIADVTGYFVD